jgi:intein/homing endonuclease
MKCRGCRAELLASSSKGLDLGKLAVIKFKSSPDEKDDYADLLLIECQNCHLVQLSNTAQFSEFHYLNGINQSTNDALFDVVKDIESRIDLKRGDIVVDIGPNDGLLLSYYRHYVKTIGFEPPNNILERYGHRSRGYFSANEYWNSLYPKKSKAKVITAIEIFYYLDDPNSFCKDVHDILDEDGIFVIQMNDLDSMIQNYSIDNVCFTPTTYIQGPCVPISDIKNGDEVTSYDGDKVRVVKTMKREYKGELCEIKARYLEKITCTPEHPILIAKKDWFRFNSGLFRDHTGQHKLEWVTAQNIKRHDFLVVPRLKKRHSLQSINLTEFNRVNSHGYRRGLVSLPLNEDIAWLMGIYVARGHTNMLAQGEVTLNYSLHQDEVQIAEKIKRIMKSIGTSVSKPHVRKDVNAAYYAVSCTSIGRAFAKWFGKTALEKQIPDFILYASETIRSAFLRGLFGDDKWRNQNQMNLRTSSPKLIRQTQLLAAALGIMLDISKSEPQEHLISERSVTSSVSWQVRDSMQSVGRIFEYDYHTLKAAQHIEVYDDYILVPVLNVSQFDYEGPVYNLETDTHTFLASNAVVHNCHEHLCYYSINTLLPLLRRNCLYPDNVSYNSVNGGSIRVICRHVDNQKPFLRYSAAEATLDLMWKNFKKERDRLCGYIDRQLKQHKSIWAYGASTRGNSLLQLLGLDSTKITAIADSDRKKWNKFTAGGNIPIKSEAHMRQVQPDNLLVLPYYFEKEFLAREQDYLAHGGRMLFPLPRFRIWTMKGDVLTVHGLF